MKKVFIKILFTSLFFSTTTPAALYLLAKSARRPLISQFFSKPSLLFSTKASGTEKVIKMPQAQILQDRLSKKEISLLNHFVS